MRSPSLDATARRIVYGLSMRWGVPAVISKVVSSETDYITGLKIRNTESKTLRRLVPLANEQRRVLYEGSSYLQSARNFAWKGGQGADINAKIFMATGEDLRGWVPDVHQWIQHGNLQYEIKEAEQVADGVAWILRCLAISRIEEITVDGLLWGDDILVWGEDTLVWT